MLSRRDLLLGSATLFGLQAMPALAAPVATTDYGPALLDVHPGPEKALGTIVHVHGGGWRNGSRRMTGEKPEFFAQLGWRFVSVDYRMLPEADVDQQVGDVAAAVRFLRVNADRLGLPKGPIVLTGHSAGAHLASLVAVTGAGGPVAGLIANDTMGYDIRVALGQQTGLARAIYANAFPDPSRHAALSPLLRIRRGIAPPTLVLWSRVAGHEQEANRFADALRAAGVRAETWGSRRLSHAAINRSIGSGEVAALDQVVASFLQAVVA